MLPVVLLMDTGVRGNSIRRSIRSIDGYWSKRGNSIRRSNIRSKR